VGAALIDMIPILILGIIAIGTFWIPEPGCETAYANCQLAWAGSLTGFVLLGFLMLACLTMMAAYVIWNWGYRQAPIHHRQVQAQLPCREREDGRSDRVLAVDPAIVAPRRGLATARHRPPTPSVRLQAAHARRRDHVDRVCADSNRGHTQTASSPNHKFAHDRLSFGAAALKTGLPCCGRHQDAAC
jgi:hypothetical protein